MAHPVAYEQLIAFAAGELADRRAADVADHLKTCRSCAGTVARYRSVASTVAADRAAPSAAAVARAKAIFPRRSGTATAPLAVLRRVVADLAYDSRGGFALAGVRSGGGATADTHRLVYESEAGDLDLQLEPPGAADGRWRVLGQVDLNGDVPDLRVLLTAPGSDEPLAAVDADAQGIFDLSVRPGTYELRVVLPSSVLVVADLDVG